MRKPVVDAADEKAAELIDEKPLWMRKFKKNDGVTLTRKPVADSVSTWRMRKR